MDIYSATVLSRPLCARRLPFSLAVYLLVCASATLGQQIPSLKTIQEIDGFVQTYYRVPRPDAIEALIVALHSTGIFRSKPNSRNGYIGFFSEVFAANPDRLPRWQDLIAREDQPTKAVLEQALAMSKAGGVSAIDGYSGPLNDMRWGAFFASGRADPVNKIIEQLRFVDEREDINRFALGAASKWSLASNAQRYARVREILEAARSNADRRTQDIITDLLQKDPARVRKEMGEIAKQRWKTEPRPGTPLM